MNHPRYPEYKPSGVKWLGEVPGHWTETRLKNVASIRVSNVDKKAVEGQEAVRLCNYVDVYYHDQITPDMEFMEATATPQQIGKFTLKKGDVLITKDSETPDDIAVPSLVANDLEGVVCGYHLALIRPEASVADGAYLARALAALGLRDQFHSSATGITRFGLSVGDISGASILAPPLEEQRAIAAFLDRETARIDALIGKKRRFIELLQARRAALISRAVTRGLDSNVPLKNSGVEWLGQIPAHWEVKSIKRTCLVKRGASPRPIDDPIYFDDNGEYSWVRISDVTSSDRYLEKTEQRLSKLGESLSVRLEPGELFLSIAGSVGKPIITEIKCCIHDGFVYFWRYKNDPEFLYYVFACGRPYQGLGKLGTQLNLNTDTVGDIRVGWPPINEQRAIAAFLDKKTKNLDALRAKVESAIERLKEYRTALIAAAVTGKIDVRAA